MLDAKGRPCQGRPDDTQHHHRDQHKAADADSDAARCDAVTAAVAELLAWSASVDTAYAAGLAMGRAQWAAAEALDREREARARAEGYAEALADMKRAERGIVGAWRSLAELEARRWSVRGAARTRAAFGAPHPGDYLGGPVAWPELPEAEPRPTDPVGNSRVRAVA